LQGLPAGPGQGGSIANLAQQAAPFDDDAVDVADAQQIGNPCAFAERVFVDGGDDLFGTGAVARWHAVFEIAGNGLDSENLITGHGETPSPAIFFTAEPEAGVEVGEIID